MTDEIIVRCASCGEEIGRITFVEGKQILGCYSCGKKTVVDIYDDGTVNIRKKGFWDNF